MEMNSHPDPSVSHLGQGSAGNLKLRVWSCVWPCKVSQEDRHLVGLRKPIYNAVLPQMGAQEVPVGDLGWITAVCLLESMPGVNR